MKSFVFAKAVQVIVLLLAAFVLLRLVAPWLVSLHDTLALIAAIVLLLAGVLAGVWFVWDLVVAINTRSADSDHSI